VQNEAEMPYFSIFKNLGPVEISGGNRFQGRNLEIVYQNHPKSRISISEVLPIEISTAKSCLKKFSLEKK